jgi:hypothetical protein
MDELIVFHKKSKKTFKREETFKLTFERTIGEYYEVVRCLRNDEKGTPLWVM